MLNARPMIKVAAGVLRDAGGRILIAERKGDAAFSDHWEFPGGKLDPGESSTDALHRELSEELGIVLFTMRHLRHLQHVYPDRAVSIDFFVVPSWFGVPTGRLGQRLRWCRPADIKAGTLLPADAPVLEDLRIASPE